MWPGLKCRFDAAPALICKTRCLLTNIVLMPLTAITAVLLYPLVLVGDGCLLVAIAVASTTKGSAWLWGLSFALFHALYGVAGITFVSEITHYSEILGELFMLGGAGYLLWHFLHHRLHHRMQADCRCENHPPTIMSPLSVVSSAAALSLHSLAGGAIFRTWLPDASSSYLITLLLISSALVGSFTFTIVALGESGQKPIVRFLDKLPGIVAFVLAALCCVVLYHLVEDTVGLSSVTMGLFLVASILASAAVGWAVHERRQAPIISISPRRPGKTD